MDRRWYIVHTHSNSEKRVAESIRDRVQKFRMEELFGEVLVPVEGVVDVRRGRKVTSERKFFPGYVLLNVAMTNDMFHLVKNTPKVTGFLGSDNEPQPISEEEAERILQQVRDGVDSPKSQILFEIGEQVRVSDGPFASFTGFVEGVDGERERITVAVSIFGRATPVELEYGQVDKM